jgi:hypothetical protein
VAVLAKDAFDRPDAATLGSDWVHPSGMEEWKVVGKTAQPVNLAAECIDLYLTASVAFPDDQYSEAVIVSMTGTADTSGVGVEVRGATSPDMRYRGYACKAATNNTCLAKHVSGTFTLLAQGTAPWADGDSIRLEVEGTTLRLIRNGQDPPVIELSDSSIASGQPGLTYSTTLTAATVGNWEGGDLIPERSTEAVFDDEHGNPVKNPKVM